MVVGWDWHFRLERRFETYSQGAFSSGFGVSADGQSSVNRHVRVWSDSSVHADQPVHVHVSFVHAGAIVPPPPLPAANEKAEFSISIRRIKIIGNVVFVEGIF